MSSLSGLSVSSLTSLILFCEAYKDHRNSPYSIVDRVRVHVSSYAKGLKCYQPLREEVDRIAERILKGGNDSDLSPNKALHVAKSHSNKGSDHLSLTKASLILNLFICL